MPTVSKWMADAMERLFSNQFHPVRVTQTEMIDSQLKRVRFQGDLSCTEYVVGNVIEFRVSDREFRHYTPASFDKEQGVCDVLFYLHGLGPGSEWVDQLQVDMATNLMGPGGKMALTAGQDRHVLFGDETSLGLTHGFWNAIERNGANFDAVLELEEEHRHWPQCLQMNARILGKSVQAPAKGILEWLEQLSEQEWRALQSASFYLTGRAQSIQRIKKSLKAKGIANKQIQTMPYWADNKKGL
ncbi:MAG: siderophore-interacting protein [Pseudomonadota bacterium]